MFSSHVRKFRELLLSLWRWHHTSKFYVKVFCHGQGPVRQAILYGDRSCYKGKRLLWLLIFFHGQWNPSKIRYAPKGKNLLQQEQILSFKSWPHLRRETNMKMTGLLPLKEYLVTLIGKSLIVCIYMQIDLTFAVWSCCKISVLSVQNVVSKYRLYQKYGTSSKNFGLPRLCSCLFYC